MTEIHITHPCPSCSSTVTFTSRHTSVCVCTCGTVLNKMTDGSILSRPFHTIADKASVIAPGTTGQWNDKTFRVTGRFRIWIEEAVVSYWTIIFQDETAAYLVEGYGMFSICLPIITPPELAQDAIKQMLPGTPKLLNKIEYMLLRKDHCKKWDVEGELFIPECNSTFVTYDFSSPTGQVLHIIEYWSKVQPTFEVHYTDFTSLALQQTRTYENAGRQFKCTCGSDIHVKTYPFAQSCVCPKCRTRYVFENTFEFGKQAKGNSQNFQPSMPLGATGTLKGISYEVVGFMIKEERNQYRSQWREYTLFNAQEGFAFLSEYNGHWIYLREQGKTPVPEDMSTAGFNYNGDSFDLFNSYNFNIVTAEGEFPGNAFNDGQIKCWEFIDPPLMWSREQSPGEGIAWFQGWHVEAKDIKTAFGDAVKLPTQTGVGAVQPNGYINLWKLLKHTLIAVGVLILLHLAVASTNREQMLLDREVYFPDSVYSQTTVIGDIHLNKWKSNVMLDLTSPVENTWMEVEATLTNTKTGTEYTVNKGVEFYSGTEGGERWSEGSHQGTVFISEVPGGDYTLTLEATREPGVLPVKYYTITALYDVANTRNLFICIGLLLIWPLFKYFSTYYSERKRWEDSPYSTFITYEDE